MNYYKLSVKDASYLLQQRKVSSVELVKSSLERIDQLEKDLNAFITVTEKEALEVAGTVDEKRKKRLGSSSFGRCSRCFKRQYMYQQHKNYLRF